MYEIDTWFASPHFVNEKAEGDKGIIIINKTGLRPVSRPVEQVHNFGVGIRCIVDFGAKADRQTDMIGGTSGTARNPF